MPIIGYISRFRYDFSGKSSISQLLKTLSRKKRDFVRNYQKEKSEKTAPEIQHSENAESRCASGQELDIYIAIRKTHFSGAFGQQKITKRDCANLAGLVSGHFR